MTITTIEEAVARANELSAMLTIIYRPLAPLDIAALVIIEPQDVPPASASAPTWEEAASVAFTFFDPVPPEQPAPQE